MRSTLRIPVARQEDHPNIVLPQDGQNSSNPMIRLDRKSATRAAPSLYFRALVLRFATPVLRRATPFGPLKVPIALFRPLLGDKACAVIQIEGLILHRVQHFA